MLHTLELIALWSLPAFLVLDLVYRRKRYTTPRHWRVRALLVSVFTFFWAGEVAAFWAARLETSLLDFSPLGMWLGAIVGIFVYELAHYGYHRFAHKNDVMWRASHQMHHSAESMDAFGANYLHPLDTAIFATLASLVFFPLLGLTVEAGVVAAAFLAFNAAFQHANIKTPLWLGYVIQRPESHAVHHRDHRKNYADLPLIDMIFGTFENAERFTERCGFYPGASARIPEMLVGRDVSRPPADEPARVDGEARVSRA